MGAALDIVTESNFEEQYRRATKLADDRYNEIKRLRREAGDLQTQIDTTARVLARIAQVQPERMVIPDWLRQDGSGQLKRATPVLMLSDLHLDEVVDSEEMDGMNAYDRTIALRRFERTINHTVDFLKSHVAGVHFDGIVCALLGDILTGNIHEELAKTNVSPVPASIVYWVPQIASGLRYLADEFGSVYVPTVDGNHDRSTKRIQYKNRVEESYAWIIYNWLADTLKDDSRIQFGISTSPEQLISIYNMRLLLAHGDGASGGQGIGGIWPPIMRWVHKKQGVYSSTGRPFDLCLMGHWHQLTFGSSFFINGSLKGYDEYARGNGFAFERPQQALFLVTPEHGITMRTSIFAED